MSSVTRYELVGKIIRDTVEEADLPPTLRTLITIPLMQEGKILSGDPSPRWPSVVLATCAAASGDPNAALRVSAGVEVFMAALDVLDEIEDGDNSQLVREAGVAQALNASTTLLLLAQSILAGLRHQGVPAERVPVFIDALTQAGLTATGGQYLDLAAEGNSDISLEGALEIARRKAGALTAGACRLGALLGTDDETLLGLYETWGRHYGTMAQIANDLHDATDRTQKSDWSREKGTLPILFARRGHNAVERVRRSPDPVNQENLEESGALHFAWLVLEVERQAALKVLSDLSARGQRVESLAELTR